MTQPRQVLPGGIYFISRRCTQREFLLRPDRNTTHIFRYCLADAAKRFGIELLAWCAMSNHWHGVIYDPYGQLPAFLQRLHRLIAKALNTLWNRWENFWAAEQVSVVRLVELADVLDKVVYTLANPVADHLVDRVFNWPGANSLRQMCGRPCTVPRPKTFFREHGRMPDEVTLVVKPPREWKGDQQSWAEAVGKAVALKESTASQERLASGRRIVGRRRLLRASPSERAATHELRGGLRPVIACKNKDRRIRELAALRHFRAAYARARARLAGGDREVLFPAGTYQLRVLGIVRCEPSPGVALS